MNFNEIVKLAEGLIVISGIAGVIFAIFKNGTTKATIASQKDLIDTLTTQVNQLRALHIDNERAISELKGQVSVYKELPLTQLSTSMTEMMKTQKEILKILNKKYRAII